MSKRRMLIVWIALLVFAWALRLVNPGNVPFGADESQLIEMALDANEQGRLAGHGVLGSSGATYGPLPVWIYQLMLVFTHDPVKMGVMRSVMVTALTLASLIWLALTLRLSRWLIAAFMLSPFLWFYSRQLWDNSFNVPLCALATAAYVDFLNRRRAWALLLAIACCPLMLMVHPMAAAFVAALGMHMLIFQRQALWLNRWRVAAVVILGLVLLHRQIYELWVRPPVTPEHRQGLDGFWFAFSGPGHFSGVGLDSFFNDDWLAAMGARMSMIWRTAVMLSMLAFAICWTGMALAAVRWINLRRLREQPSLRDHAALLGLCVVVAQLLLNGLTKTWGHPQYFNATWIAFALLAWLTVNWLIAMQPVVAHGMTAVWAASLAVIVIVLHLHLQTTAGTRDTHHGPTLAAQIAVARQIAAYDANSKLSTNLAFFHNARLALPTLVRLQPRPAQPLPAATLQVQFARDDPGNARLRLIVK